MKVASFMNINHKLLQEQAAKKPTTYVLLSQIFHHHLLCFCYFYLWMQLA